MQGKTVFDNFKRVGCKCLSVLLCIALFVSILPAGLVLPKAKAAVEYIALNPAPGTPGGTLEWNNGFTAPGSGVVARMRVRDDAETVEKTLNRDSRYSRDGVNWSEKNDVIVIEPNEVVFIYTPKGGFTSNSGLVVVLPNVKADVDVSCTPNQKDFGAYFLVSYARDCSSLMSLGVPDTSSFSHSGQSFMHTYAYGCSGLTSLGVPNTSNMSYVESDFMTYYAFGCSSLVRLDVPDLSNIVFGNLNGQSYYFMVGYARGCSKLTKLPMPDTSKFTSGGEQFMSQYAYDCSSLIYLDVPDTSNITKTSTGFMSHYAYGARSLKTVKVPDTSKITDVVNFMSMYAGNCISAEVVYLPDLSSVSKATGTIMDGYSLYCENLSTYVATGGVGLYSTKNIDFARSPGTGSSNKLQIVVPAEFESDWKNLITSGKTLFTNGIKNADDVIAKRMEPCTISTPEVREELIYTGEQIELLTTAPVSDFGEVVYAVRKADEEEPLKEDGAYSSAFPAATEPGEYIVYYYAKAPNVVFEDSEIQRTLVLRIVVEPEPEPTPTPGAIGSDGEDPPPPNNGAPDEKPVITIQINDINACIGDEIVYGYTCVGLLDGHVFEDVIFGNIIYSVDGGDAIVIATEPGEFAITGTGLISDLYDIEILPGRLTIEPAETNGQTDPEEPPATEPDEPVEPVEPSAEVPEIAVVTNEEEEEADVPKTGDANMMLISLTSLLAMAGIAALKKRKKEDMN
ncbi:LPXTG cell wall anchor domain-containing protein [Treponema sp. R6D11]